MTDPTFASELKALREKHGVRCDNCTFGDFEGNHRQCTLKMDFTAENNWCESWQARYDP